MADAEPPFRLLSYRALAEVWGCSVEAAQERVRRHKWRKQPGNSRQVLIAVPLHALEEPVGDDLPRTPIDLREEVRSQRERESQALRDRAEKAEAAAQAAQADATQARREADRAKGEADGLREAVRIAEDAVRRTEMARQAAEDREKNALRRAEGAEEARQAFLAAPWWRRLMGRP